MAPDRLSGLFSNVDQQGYSQGHIARKRSHV